MFEVTLYGADREMVLKLEINPTIAPESFFGSHLLTQALVELIEQADVSGWEKHPDDELSPSEFYAAIVGAVASSVAIELPESISLREAMINVVDDALAKRLLDNTFEDNEDVD